MRKISYIIFVISLFVAYGCNDDLLDTDNLFNKSFDSFYQRPVDIDEAMNGVYNAMYVGSPHSNEHIAANLLSDLMLAGGGPDDKSAKNVDRFEDPAEDTYGSLWVETYNGVYRSNAIIEAVQTVDFSAYFKTVQESDDYKNQALGEAYFMRGFFMFRAAKFFGGMPLINTTVADRTVDRSSFKETFAQILSDFKIAAETLPATKAQDIPLAQYGHANKWVAEAYIARAYLFATGYLTNMAGEATSSITLTDNSSLDNASVAAYLDNCMTNSGYELTSDFRNLWPYSYVNTSAGSDVLPWATTEGLAWVGQDGPNTNVGTGNNEVMFAQRYAFGNWSWDKGNNYNNLTCLYMGIRDNSMTPFGQGWGWGTIHKTFDADWKAKEVADGVDVRREGSILYMGDANQGTDTYEGNHGDHETGMFNKKYTTLQHGGAEGTKGMFYYLFNWDNGDPMQLWAAQDFYFMRYSDVLLMHSELTDDAAGLNAVRARAGLAGVAYSLNAIKEERKYEFAFEGIRWFDLVRWGDVENSAMNYFDDEIEVNMTGGSVDMYSVSYRTVTKGLVPIPESEIRLSGNVYTQNPGW